jgi:colanic acid/amylovoran biosynthesis glycosyltransferase
MRLAFIVGEFPAISQTFILRQITGLLDRGHDVEIFAHSSGKDSVVHRDIEKYALLNRTCYLGFKALPANGIARVAKRVALLCLNFHKKPRAVLNSLNAFRFGRGAVLLQVFNSILPFLEKGPYDIVHCHFGLNGDLGVLLRDTGVFDAKVITTFYGYDVSSYLKSSGRNVYDDLFARGDLFLCVSEHMKSKLAKLGCEPQKIIVHRSGAELKKPDLALRKAKTTGEKMRIVSIARLVEKKGIQYAIQAVAAILRRRGGIEYRIAGDGPLRDKLQSLIKELNAGDHIKLLGWKTQAEIRELLRTSDVLLAPSVTAKTGDEEGIPGVIMEAFGHGLAVISTYHAGIPEVVKEGETGFLVTERDVDALKEKLETLIERPEVRFAMGQNGRKLVEEQYDIDQLNERLVNIYQELLKVEPPRYPDTPARLEAATFV